MALASVVLTGLWLFSIGSPCLATVVSNKYNHGVILAELLGLIGWLSVAQALLLVAELVGIIVGAVAAAVLGAWLAMRWKSAS